MGANFGIAGLDWQQRVNWDRLREYRIERARQMMKKHEPKVHAELKRLKNVILNPHLGSATLDVREEMANIVVDNIEALLGGRMPPNCVNPQVLGK